MPRLKNSEQKLVFAHMWDFISHLVETPELAEKFPTEIRDAGLTLMSEARQVGMGDDEILSAKGLFNGFEEPGIVDVPEVQTTACEDAQAETHDGRDHLEE